MHIDGHVTVCNNNRLEWITAESTTTITYRPAGWLQCSKASTVSELTEMLLIERGSSAIIWSNCLTRLLNWNLSSSWCIFSLFLARCCRAWSLSPCQSSGSSPAQSDVHQHHTAPLHQASTQHRMDATNELELNALSKPVSQLHAILGSLRVLLSGRARLRSFLRPTGLAIWRYWPSETVHGPQLGPLY